MSTAVLLAVRPSPEHSLLPRLVGQLRAGGVGRIVVLARPDRTAPDRIMVGSNAELESLTVVTSADIAADLATIARLCRDAGDSAESLIIGDADLVAHDSVIAGLLALPSGEVNAVTGATTKPAGHQLSTTPVRVERGRVISVATGWHRVADANAGFAGLLRVDATRAAPAGEALDAATTSLPAEAAALDPLALCLAALARAGLVVRARGVGARLCAPATTDADIAHAEQALLAVDEDAARMRAAVKADDDLFATYAVSTWSPRLVRLAARLGLSPTAVTWCSVALALVAAVAFGQGGRPAMVAGAALLYLSFVLDCVDGQLARYTKRFARFGGWLDTLADRGKEYAVYAGLAVGAAHTGVGDVWPLAVAAITLQTVRHMTDSWYGYARDQAVARLALAPFSERADPAAASHLRSGTARDDARDRPGASRVDRAVRSLALATNVGRRSVMYWIKKTVVFPIGERWLVIAVGVAFFDARWVFVVLLAWGALAAAYTVLVRILRTRYLRAPTLSTVDTARYRDDGPLARALGALVARLGVAVAPLPTAVVAAAAAALTAAFAAVPAARTAPWAAIAAVAVTACLLIAALATRSPHDGYLDWLVPGALRAAELTAVVALALAQHVPPGLLYALLGVLVLLHYDLSAGLNTGASPLVGRAVALGWDGRLLVLAAAAVAGQVGIAVPATVATPGVLGFAALGAYLTGVLVVGAVVGVHRSRPRGEDRPALPPRQRSGDGLTAARR